MIINLIGQEDLSAIFGGNIMVCYACFMVQYGSMVWYGTILYNNIVVGMGGQACHTLYLRNPSLFNS